MLVEVALDRILGENSALSPVDGDQHIVTRMRTDCFIVSWLEYYIHVCLLTARLFPSLLRHNAGAEVGAAQGSCQQSQSQCQL
jgi:hypothetical protein